MRSYHIYHIYHIYKRYKAGATRLDATNAVLEQLCAHFGAALRYEAGAAASGWCIPFANATPVTQTSQDPAKRPSFARILEQLYAMKQERLGDTLDALRPRGNYNPTTDCGCSIM